jgi:hypothetical protein
MMTVLVYEAIAMNIKHNPIFDTNAVIASYEKKDGVPITYVCTSALNHGTLATDVFYRETPHPEFGNRYFALYMNGENQVMITNADCIEDLEFTMVEVDGELHYSQHRHDFRTIGDISIDGGRAYNRILFNGERPKRNSLKVKDGKFVQGVIENEYFY